MKAETKGNKINIDFGSGGCHVFVAGGRKRALIEHPGMVAVNGLVKLNDGTECFAILTIDETSSGEHWGTGIFIDDPAVITFQDDPDFLEKLGKTKDQVFPYSYKYTGEVRTLCDHHVGDDGWS